jgi:hypothetical protein
MQGHPLNAAAIQHLLQSPLPSAAQPAEILSALHEVAAPSGGIRCADDGTYTIGVIRVALTFLVAVLQSVWAVPYDRPAVCGTVARRRVSLRRRPYWRPDTNSRGICASTVAVRRDHGD